MSEAPLIFIDVETTGTRATRDRITEVAALKVVDGSITERWSSLINPGCKIPAHISQLTGIKDGMLTHAPSFQQVAAEFRQWLGDGRLVAHNARFDYSFLRNEFKRSGIDFRATLICTLRVSRRLAPQAAQHNLAALVERYAIAVDRHHRAEDDALALWQLWQAWQRLYDKATWQAALGDEQRHRSLPAHLDSTQLEGLPSTPGVYLFYGHNRLPLYVGKSINLRSRVLGHFQRDYQDDKEMRLAQQIQHVEWEETAGDMGAQLREAQLIKQLMPIMNRQLRRQGKLNTWHWPAKQHAPTLINGSALGQPQSGSFYGLFRSAKEAKDTLRSLSETHQLCPQVLGLEKGKGRCFANQLGKCKGACCGKEGMKEHTQRAQEAMEKLQVGTWPWPGRIVIREKGQNTRSNAYHVVDHWCYLGRTGTLTAARKLIASNPQFDADTYRILNRFLRNPEQHCLKITQLENQPASMPKTAPR
ncbi:3'-5' exonuclease family protein [Halomonas sp. GFAJ-1]|uniref:3'-5' exonuclease family protein n=1 Tax=Halomonas sp. GFAJ-1 TaxID=1118153 RepID=UPI00023A3386|nr:3'-5' exonuclease family protein [Halomonas sp. GFAJ-1]AVI63515.1 DNA polymerase III subunit epsilon [Halomonas sp. GFAJ-1]EHK61501.1 DNA polymerase III subunit epsilon [Halomonas sp. GFAJ-1]